METNRPRNAEARPARLGGEEVNTSPTHAHHRYVIDFFDRPLDQRGDPPTMVRNVRARARTMSNAPDLLTPTTPAR